MPWALFNLKLTQKSSKLRWELYY